MLLNADFARRATMHAADLPWSPSPIQGVERRMLDRVGAEVARATSIVRYAAHSWFSAHTHGGGEEFFVLDGVFQDEHGDYPRGTYVRNPPGTSHTPRSALGCTIFVKLWQFNPIDRTSVRIDTTSLAFQPAAARTGVATAHLFQDDLEEVRLERWSPDAEINLALPTGGEIVVLEDSFYVGKEEFKPLAWLRLPSRDTLCATAGQAGCTVWMKIGGQRPAPKVDSDHIEA